MNLKDTISTLSNVQIDDVFVAQLDKMYGVSLPDEVRKIVSISTETVFYDDFSLLRGLSHAEILSASSDMSVDFIGKHLLPLFDVGDNDYIVFATAEKTWYRFNIVDEVEFDKAENLSVYL